MKISYTESLSPQILLKSAGGTGASIEYVTYHFLLCMVVISHKIPFYNRYYPGGPGSIVDLHKQSVTYTGYNTGLYSFSFFFVLFLNFRFIFFFSCIP